VGFIDDGQPVGTMVHALPQLGALSLAWDLKRLFAASDQATQVQLVVTHLAHGDSVLSQQLQPTPI
jgi:hypothetical protein